MTEEYTVHVTKEDIDSGQCAVDVAIARSLQNGWSVLCGPKHAWIGGVPYPIPESAGMCLMIHEGWASGKVRPFSFKLRMSPYMGGTWANTQSTLRL